MIPATAPLPRSGIYFLNRACCLRLIRPPARDPSAISSPNKKFLAVSLSRIILAAAPTAAPANNPPGPNIAVAPKAPAPAITPVRPANLAVLPLSLAMSLVRDLDTSGSKVLA